MAAFPDRFFTWLLARRRAILMITVVVFALCLFSLFNVRVNSDLARYLPDDSVTKQTTSLLTEAFSVYGDAAVCVQGELSDYDDIKALIAELASVQSIDTIGWLGSYEGLFTLENGRITPASPFLPDENVSSLTDGYYKTVDGKGYYLCAVSLSVPNVDGAASKAMDEYKRILSAYSEAHGNADYALGGNAIQGKTMIDSALRELPYFLILAAAAITVILLVTNKSYMGALIFVMTIGISIVYNLGTNFFTDSISTVTFSVAAILQLALSMDYSIFLTHAYERAKEEGVPNPMIHALKRTSVTIFASSLTTVAGFCALFFMRYTMGFDIGLCLAKGTLLSLLTVLFVQPCLMITFEKACERTKHRALCPNFERFSRVPGRARIASLLLVILIAVPAILLSEKLDYYYLETDYSDTSTGAKGVLDADGTQAVFVVPLISDDTQLSFLEKLAEWKRDGKISSVTGLYSTVDGLLSGVQIPVYLSQDDQSTANLLSTITLTTSDAVSAINTGTLPEARIAQIKENLASAMLARVPAMVDEEAKKQEAATGQSLSGQARRQLTTQIIASLQANMQNVINAQMDGYMEQFSLFAAQFEELKNRFLADVNGETYTYYALSISGAPEGEQALSTVEEIEKEIKARFGSAYYAAGNTQAVRDMASVTGRDFIVVNIVSAILILIILIVTFKGFWMPVLMVALIELAILVNMSFSTLMGGSINFMTYVVISAIQLGATIDYAILLVKDFRETQEQGSPRREAARLAVRHTAFSILISMAILSSACLSVYIISSDAIIREVTSMLSRGAVISAFMVLFVLPGLLSLKKE